MDISVLRIPFDCDWKFEGPGAVCYPLVTCYRSQSDILKHSKGKRSGNCDRTGAILTVLRCERAGLAVFAKLLISSNLIAVILICLMHTVPRLAPEAFQKVVV